MVSSDFHILKTILVDGGVQHVGGTKWWRINDLDIETLHVDDGALHVGGTMWWIYSDFSIISTLVDRWCASCGRDNGRSLVIFKLKK
jgi:hypothetical protein